MSEQAETNLARILAPLALLVCAIAFFAVVLSSGGRDSDEGERGPEGSERRASKKGGSRSKDEPRTGAASYTVKTGDTLAGIAQKTGVSVEALQERNPELDPQALVSGQKIKLRE